MDARLAIQTARKVECLNGAREAELEDTAFQNWLVAEIRLRACHAEAKNLSLWNVVKRGYPALAFKNRETFRLG